MEATKEATKETSGTVAKCSTVLTSASDSPLAENSTGCLFLSSNHRGMYNRAEVMKRRENTYLKVKETHKSRSFTIKHRSLQKRILIQQRTLQVIPSSSGCLGIGQQMRALFLVNGPTSDLLLLWVTAAPLRNGKNSSLFVVAQGERKVKEDRHRDADECEN